MYDTVKVALLKAQTGFFNTQISINLDVGFSNLFLKKFVG